MPTFLRSLDVLVLPSLWPENLPIVMLEAHACGVCVLASDVGGMSEFIGDPRFLFLPNSIGALAQCLHTWRSNTSALDATAPAGVVTADEMCERTITLYESCAGLADASRL